MPRHRDDAVTKFDRGDTLPQRIDDTGGFTAGREWPGWFGLIFVLDDQHIGKIDTDRVDFNPHFALAGFRHRHVADDQ